MKSSAWDNRLWQIKMQELPLEGDANTAWDKMQGLLDETMPVAQDPGVVRKLWGLPRSLVLTVICTVAAAAILFFTAHYLLKNHPHKTTKPNKENVKPVTGQPDNNTSTNNKVDSANNSSTVPLREKGDSLNAENASPKANNNAVTNSHNDQKRAGGTNANHASKHQNILAQSQSVAAGSVLVANSKNKGTIKPNSATLNIPLRTPIIVLQKKSHNKPSTTGHYLAGRRNAGLYSARQHSRAWRLAANSGNNRPQNQPATIVADKNASKTNSLSIINKGNPVSGQNSNKPVSNAPGVQQKNIDPAKIASNKTNPVSKPVKPIIKPAAKNNTAESYSKFQVDIEAGINISKNATPYAGLYGSYAINSRFSISTGASMFSSRTIAGKYNISKYKYTTQDDSGRTTSRTANNLLVSTSQKINTLEIPLIATYKITKWLSVKGGPVISIPIKTGSIQNVLAPVGTTLDTARAFKTLSSAVNGTTILNKVNLNITGGILININRVYFNAGFVQETGPYKIYSSLGSSNIYYHYVQLGIGYKLFKSKAKKPLKK